eukprot:COSAG04_NODE_54_length_30630_cov_12.996233_2_plen_35_part_00
MQKGVAGRFKENTTGMFTVRPPTPGKNGSPHSFS